jgi:hypothetical protein
MVIVMRAPVVWGAAPRDPTSSVFTGNKYNFFTTLGYNTRTCARVAEYFQVVHGLRGGIDLGYDLLVDFKIWVDHQISFFVKL